MRNSLCLAALSVVGLLSPSVHGAELLVNGGFESAVQLNADGYCYQGWPGQDCGGISGWNGVLPLQIAATSTFWGSPGVLAGFDASLGHQVAAIQNTYNLQQAVTVTGGSYALQWLDAGRPAYDDQQYEVRFSGTILGTFDVQAGQAWSLHQATFTAPAGLHLLEFAGVGAQTDGTVFLDNIRLTAVSAVPEPASSALLLAGLGLVAGVARRSARLNPRSSSPARCSCA